MLVASDNEVSYMRTLYLMVCHFFWGESTITTELMKPLLKKHGTEFDYRNQEEGGIDNETAIRIRNELSCIDENREMGVQDHKTYVLSYYK